MKRVKEKTLPYNRLVQYACYAFYPLHILVLAVLWLYVL